LPSRNVYDLLETRGGVYWVSTGGGLVLFDPDALTRRDAEGAPAPGKLFTLVPFPEGSRATEASLAYEDAGGAIWCGTDHGLYKLGGEPGAWRLELIDRVTLSLYDGDGRLVMQTVETVELGKSVSLDVPAGEIPSTVRKRLRATVHVEALPGGLVPCVMPSLKVFNGDTGKTSLFYPGAMIGE
jgi:ligand-binding sensor domain-containing protein